MAWFPKLTKLILSLLRSVGDRLCLAWNVDVQNQVRQRVDLAVNVCNQGI